MKLPIVMSSVREHAEGFDVVIDLDPNSGRIVVRAENEGGYKCTEIDFIDLIAWLDANEEVVRELKATPSATQKTPAS